MFIAHLPAAYVGHRVLAPRLPALPLAALLAGSVAPDIDLLAFYFVDGRAFHHHEYVTHKPALWMVLLFCGALMMRMRPGPAGAAICAFGCGGVLHVMLDSIAGRINWGWPLGDMHITLVTVPAKHDHWILSFLSHWTFLVELAICALALFLWMRRPH